MASIVAPKGANRRKTIVGRGHSSNGRRCGRGNNGQNARSGGGVRPGFEGGQMPLQRRVPKRGFNNIFRTEYAIVNISALDAFNDGDTVTVEALVEKGIVKKTMDGVKILGNGELTKKLNVKVNAYSESESGFHTA